MCKNIIKRLWLDWICIETVNTNEIKNKVQILKNTQKISDLLLNTTGVPAAYPDKMQTYLY